LAGQLIFKGSGIASDTGNSFIQRRDMLTRIYRYGPGRQRILKGFVVAGVRADSTEETVGRIAQQVVQYSPSFLPRDATAPVTLRSDPRQPTVIWFDTGWIWLHTPRARIERFVALGAAISAVAEAVRGAGGVLLPNAVRLFPALSWSGFLCPDRHLIESGSDLEKAVFCNLIRQNLPALIAISGRAGVSPNGVETIGTRRLADSAQNYAPHYLAAVSPPHLTRMEQMLRLEEGVQQLWMLDVNPRADEELGNQVELRFIDGQMLLSTVRAHALLFEALFIKARRWARDGREVEKTRQNVLQRNRARAIAEGLQARFEREMRRESKPASSHGKDAIKPLPARQAVLNLIEDLQYELQVLETDYRELAPLTLGVTLRGLGRAALQNENDLLRLIQRESNEQREVFVDRVSRLVSDQNAADAWSQWNQQRFPDLSRGIGEWWEYFLHKPVGKQAALAQPVAPKQLSPAALRDGQGEQQHPKLRPLGNHRDQGRQQPQTPRPKPQGSQPRLPLRKIDQPRQEGRQQSSATAAGSSSKTGKSEFCPQCGHQSRGGAKFCSNCGSQLPPNGGVA
jgi:hypothetical protein